MKIATFAKPETVKVQLIDIQHTVATQELSPFEAEARLNPFKKAKYHQQFSYFFAIFTSAKVGFTQISFYSNWGFIIFVN